MFKFSVLTVSDQGARGEREDKSGKMIAKILKKLGVEKASYQIVPDNQEKIKDILSRIADSEEADLILTTGGTGFAERDITPEATLAVIDKEVPGIPEYMRQKTAEITEMAVLSRGRAGIRNSTLIVNLPGNPKAVRECLECIIGILPHGIEILKGDFTEH